MTSEAVAAPGSGANRLSAAGVSQLLRGSGEALLDLTLIAAACAFTAVELDQHLWAVSAADAGVLGAVAVTTLVVLGGLLGRYPSRAAKGSFEGMAALWKTALGTTTVVVVVAGALDTGALSSAIVVAAALSLVLMSAVGGASRLVHDHRRRPRRPLHRAIVFGAGEAGQNITRVLLHTPGSEIVPVVMLDDDPRKSTMRIAGLSVLGGRERLAEARERFDADTLLIAVASGGRGLVAELAALAGGLGLHVKVLPPLEELLLGLATDVEIRSLEPSQLLGRREVVIDLDAVAGYLAGKRVLVTGAGGSIGSELCRQLSGLGLEELIMLDRDESALHAVQLSLDGRGLLDGNGLVVADIRDRHRLDDIFASRRPHVVFHAAALKHLPLLQMYPTEAVKTNIWGTQNVLDSAARFGVERFVNISTDKAANAISVLGWSKRIGERLTASASQRQGRTFLSVRFGNVLGSRGSVLTAFYAQVAAGGPVTVTHPDVTRYFMTVQEAVRLVIQSGAIGAPGEVLVLDMGQPVRIDDVARRLVYDAEHPIEIIYTGLRPGEKLHEVLLGDGEPDRRPHHPLISQVPVPGLDPCELAGLNGIRARDPLIEALRELAAVTIDLTTEFPAPRRAWQAEPADAVGA